MSKAKLVFATLALVLSLLASAQKSEAVVCGDNCTSCSNHADGGYTCCYWVGGHFTGCETIH